MQVKKGGKEGIIHSEKKVSGLYLQNSIGKKKFFREDKGPSFLIHLLVIILIISLAFAKMKLSRPKCCCCMILL